MTDEESHAATSRLSTKAARGRLTAVQESELARARQVIMSTPSARAAKRAMLDATFVELSRQGGQEPVS